MKTITLCSSMAFYKELFEIGEYLEKKDLHVLYPESALVMKRNNDFNPENFKNSVNPKQKGELIKLHFSKILKADSILVINNSKNGINGYIGANVLMEMGIAFNSQIKIYLLNPISDNQPFQEEIHAMSPVVINGNLDIIK